VRPEAPALAKDGVAVVYTEHSPTTDIPPRLQRILGHATPPPPFALVPRVNVPAAVTA